jgi:ubiquinone/menaquinone biosynthesis C-methylase UbiE
MLTLDTKDMYQRRFDGDTEFRARMWQVLCEDFFQKYIPPQSVVLELAAGYCEFINNIQAARKIAVDINTDTRQRAATGVEVILNPTTDLSLVPDQNVDVVFVSNFFEHLTRDDIVKTLRETYRVLKSGGRFLILQPNIRFVQKDYWMFFDHITPIDDRALAEALEIVGFKIRELRPRFLPYTTKSRLPKSLFLLRLYLKLPFLHRILGGQAFVYAEK